MIKKQDRKSGTEHVRMKGKKATALKQVWREVAEN
jgi:hypothetical protein